MIIELEVVVVHIILLLGILTKFLVDFLSVMDYEIPFVYILLRQDVNVITVAILMTLS